MLFLPRLLIVFYLSVTTAAIAQTAIQNPVPPPPPEVLPLIGRTYSNDSNNDEFTE
jgi:hypothetical protein